ncbi:MAG: hypothetical protein NTW06_04560, partial [Candidatus Falkowbacteria bacterium]|nr:hypothetical protein [Candidatus Falkowbacteria bacterium]
LYKEPTQEAIQMDSISQVVKGVKYTINPQYNYELWGLVVSENDNEVWYSRFKTVDPLNTKDFCVIWGDNLKSGNYRDFKFKSEEFVCIFSSNKYVKFNGEQLSNNHLLPADDEIYQQIRQAHIGDQIHFKGYLVNYRGIDQNGQEFTRSTSNTRTDTGDGACETVYATDFDKIKSSNTIFRILYIVSEYLIILSLLVIIVIVIYNFFKPEKEAKKSTSFVERNKKYKNLLPPSVGEDLK